MEIVRKYLTPDEISPPNQRYDEAADTVQVTPDGGTTWIDQPELDPRTVNQFAPLTGVTAQCDAAARMSAALEDVLTALLTAMQGGAGVAAIQGILLGWLAVFALFSVLVALVALIAAIIAAIGYVVLFGEFDGFDWDSLTCLIFCRVDAGGQLNATSVANLKADITSNYTSVQATVINALIDYAGFGGLNAFAASRSETGDCAACECIECLAAFFGQGQGGWIPNYPTLPDCPHTYYDSGADAMVATHCDSASNTILLSMYRDVAFDVKQVVWGYEFNTAGTVRSFGIYVDGSPVYSTTNFLTNPLVLDFSSSPLPAGELLFVFTASTGTAGPLAGDIRCTNLLVCNQVP